LSNFTYQSPFNLAGGSESQSGSGLAERVGHLFFDFGIRSDRRFSTPSLAGANHPVGQAKERGELMSVPGQPAIPHFPMTKEIL
jgi:hypothetical protein